MQANHSPLPHSFMTSDSPTVFGELFSPDISVANWLRPTDKVIARYFEFAAPSLSLGVRSVFAVSNLKAELTERLPQGIGKEQAVEDIYLLADMLTCLFDCQEVGLRLTALEKAMCPRFHVDNIPVRLVTTYCGSGTQWLPNELADPDALSQTAAKFAFGSAHTQKVHQLNAFEVALLKGSAWDEAHPAAIHRSCEVETDQQRVLLTLDPL